ncbi:MAG: ribosomal RNA small subunit methyltransferase A [Myxococcales bacterium]|nr:ribosomal RNA small subunit methyltransferase A [Myxococcales bacterium]
MSFTDPRTVLARHGLRPKRSFGQNFLVAESIVARIAALCVPEPGTHVVEIGAGLGTLTQALLDRGARVTAIERDRDLLPVLRKELSAELEEGRLTLLEADAAQVDYAALFRDGGVLAGNLPYQITGRLIELATDLPGLSRAVFMVQREVADRLASVVDGEAWGQLSVFVQAAFSVERAFVVSAGCFHPAPQVESAVVVLTPLAQRRALETSAFRAVVHAAFGARRKTLRNALGRVAPAEVFAATGIDLGRRGETLSIEEFAALAAVVPGRKS